MKRSSKRILTTTVGSMVRPPEVLEIIKRKRDGDPYSAEDLAVLREHVKQGVLGQAKAGIDIPSDGEYSKNGFSGYISDRLNGFEAGTGLVNRGGGSGRGRERRKFPDFYDPDGAPPLNPTAGVVCTGPITYRGEAAVEADIANFQAALEGQGFEEAFIPACGPGTIELQRSNYYYKSDQEYLYAIADAMKTEYRMIVDAGFILQIDDPRILTEWDSTDPEPTGAEYRKFAEIRIEALNHALAGLPEDRIRYHVCWGSWPGPHVTDVPLKEIAPALLKVNAGAFSVEASNPSHDHEYHVWEKDVKFPDGKIIIPGVISHSTSHVEHPELVAERILRYAAIAGRENVIATADCGFAQGAGTARTSPSIMWEKFRRLAEGAELASKKLWS